MPRKTYKPKRFIPKAPPPPRKKKSVVSIPVFLFLDAGPGELVMVGHFPSTMSCARRLKIPAANASSYLRHKSAYVYAGQEGKYHVVQIHPDRSHNTHESNREWARVQAERRSLIAAANELTTIPILLHASDALLRHLIDELSPFKPKDHGQQIPTEDNGTALPSAHVPTEPRTGATTNAAT